MSQIIATKNKIDPISGFNWEAEKELRFIYLYELKKIIFGYRFPKIASKESGVIKIFL